MSSIIPSDGGSKGIRSFWERKEGTTGMVALGVAGLAVVFAGNAFLPHLITFLGLATSAIGATMVLAVSGLALAAFLFFVTNSRVQNMVSYSFKVSMRKATNVFVATYPVEIMQEVISTMIKKKEIFGLRKADVKKTSRTILETINENDRQRKAALANYQAATKRGQQKEAILYSREAGKLDEVNARHIASQRQIEGLYERLNRIDEMIDFKIKDMQVDVRLLKQENDVSNATKGALSAGWALLKGSADMELYDAASEYIIEDYRNTLGQLDDFMADTESIMNGIDLQNGMWEEKALAQLSILDNKEQMLLTKTSHNVLGQPIHAQPEEAVLVQRSDISAKYFK